MLVRLQFPTAVGIDQKGQIDYKRGPLQCLHTGPLHGTPAGNYYSVPSVLGPCFAGRIKAAGNKEPRTCPPGSDLPMMSCSL